MKKCFNSDSKNFESRSIWIFLTFNVAKNYPMNNCLSNIHFSLDEKWTTDSFVGNPHRVDGSIIFSLIEKCVWFHAREYSISFLFHLLDPRTKTNLKIYYEFLAHGNKELSEFKYSFHSEFCERQAFSFNQTVISIWDNNILWFELVDRKNITLFVYQNSVTNWPVKALRQRNYEQWKRSNHFKKMQRIWVLMRIKCKKVTFST